MNLQVQSELLTKYRYSDKVSPVITQTKDGSEAPSLTKPSYSVENKHI